MFFKNQRTIRRKGFALVMALLLFIAVSFFIAATMPMITMEADTVRNVSSYAKKCIMHEGASDLNSQNCVGAIKGCQAGFEKDCNTIFYYADTHSDEVFKLSRKICDDGGEKACLFLLKRCAQSSDDCIKGTTDNDLNYYLELPYTDTNVGREYIQEIGTDFYNHGMTNFNAEVESVCNAEFEATQTLDSTACKIMGAQLYNYTFDFDEVDKPQFNEENSTDGTKFDSGYLTMQPQSGGAITEYQMQYGGNLRDEGYELVVKDGYVYIVGTEDSDDDTTWRPPDTTISENLDIVAMKIDEATGEVVWKTQYGGWNVEVGYDVAISDDGTYLYVTGYECTDTDGGLFDIDMFVMKLKSSNGQVVWKRRYGGTIYEYGFSIVLSGSYLYLAGTEYTTDGMLSPNSALLKLNESDGSIVWKYIYGGPTIGIDKALSIIISGSYLYISGQNHNSNLYVIKLNASTGVISWKKEYSTTSNINIYAAGSPIVKYGSYLYVAGHEAQDADGGGKDIFVIKLNESNGSIVWKNQYGGAQDDIGEDMVVTSDGAYLYVTGSTKNTPDIFVMKLRTSDGKVIWKKRAGGAGADAGKGIVLSEDETVLYVTGYEGSDGDGGNHDILLMRLGADQPVADAGLDSIWTLEGTTLNTEIINNWTLNGSELSLITNHEVPPWGVNTISSANDKWPLEGNTLDLEIIDEWTLEGTTLNTEIINNWTYGISTSVPGEPAEAYYFARTTNLNNVLDIHTITSVTIDETVPANSSTKWLVSFDGRAQWKRWNGSSWVDATTDLSTYDFTANGNDSSEIITGLTNYTLPSGSTSLDFVVDLGTTDGSTLPEINQVVINYYSP